MTLHHLCGPALRVDHQPWQIVACLRVARNGEQIDAAWGRAGTSANRDDKRLACLKRSEDCKQIRGGDRKQREPGKARQDRYDPRSGSSSQNVAKSDREQRRSGEVERLT